jgi:hypothetical protein
MTTGLQGSWTVSVAAKNAAWAQRFRVDGTTNGADGVYTGATSTPAVFATGSQWGVTVEHNPSGPVSWTPSRQRLANPRVSGGQFLFDIQTDDGGGSDEDFNDLILTCAMPLSATDWVVYGKVQTYSGFCRFNPCYPFPYIVIDTRLQLERLVAYEPIRKIIEKLYPDVVDQIVRRPIPLPDPPPFRPLLIPTGLQDEPGIRVTGRTVLEPAGPTTKGRATAKAAAAATAAGAAAADVAEQATLSLHTSFSKTIGLSASDLLVLGGLKGPIFPACDVEPVSETLLRFLEYDRTPSELAGGAYTGTGNRETLGQTATDEFGNYVFRFARTVGQIIAEAADIGAGELPAVAALPDVIVQIMQSLPAGVAFETAPYYDIPNIKRIDLCIPESELDDLEQPCQSGRAIQTLGNIAIVPNPDSLIHADGTVSNTGAVAGPEVHHAAWVGGIYIYGCFEGTSTPVKHYTWEYRREGEPDWNFINEPYSYLKQQPDATWLDTPVGAFDTSLRVNLPTDPKVVVPAYQNIETDPAFLISQRHRKLILTTSLYQAGFGAVNFRMRGYDASGEKVPGAVDTVKLLIDQLFSTGDVDYVALSGGGDPGECALIELPTVGSALVIRYRVRDPQGFLASYGLSVYRGSNSLVALTSPISGAYTNAAPFRYHGTPDEGGDLDGYVEVAMTPANGDWLDGNVFCAFDFELSSADRVTDGQGTPGSRILWRELVGLSHTPPPPMP